MNIKALKAMKAHYYPDATHASLPNFDLEMYWGTELFSVSKQRTQDKSHKTRAKGLKKGDTDHKIL